MILKKRYKRILQSWIEGIRLEKEWWRNGQGYNIYYIPANSSPPRFLFGKDPIFNSIYYYKISHSMILNILLELGLKEKIEKLQRICNDY